MSSTKEFESVPLIYEILRREDLARFRVALYNIELDESSQLFRRTVDSAEAYLLLTLPPQHLVEETVAGTSVVIPLKAWEAAPATILFKLRDPDLTFPATVESLLDWNSIWQPARSWTTPGGNELRTAIELPAGLLLAPELTSKWDSLSVNANDTRPWKGIWYRRLESGANPNPGLVSVLDWVERPGEATSHLPPPSRSHRWLLAGATLQTRNFMVSSLGGWLDSCGRAAHLQWTHKATMGRDQFVEVLAGGSLFPFAFEASMSQTAERIITSATQGGSGDFPAAVLKWRTELIIPASTLTFDRAVDGQNRQVDKLIPFRSLKIEAQIQEIEVQCVPGTNCESQPESAAFWPMLQTPHSPVYFQITALDHVGREIRFSMPMIWVSEGVRGNAAMLASVVEEYNADNRSAWSTVGFGGASIHFAAGTSESVLDNRSSLVTESLSFKGYLREPTKFGAEMASARILLSNASRLVGSTDRFDLKWHKNYVSATAAPPRNGIFGCLQPVVRSPFETAEPENHLLPPVQLDGVSASYGVTSGTDELSGKDFDSVSPLKFFKDDGVGIKIFGEIRLADILRYAIKTASALPDVIAWDVYHSGSTIDNPTAKVWNYTWFPIISPFGPFRPGRPEAEQEIDKANRLLRIKGVVGLPSNDRASYRVELELTDFSLEFGMLTVKFDRLSVALRSDAKPDVDVRLKGTEFLQDLTFMRALALLLGQFGDEGFSITVTDDSIGIHFGIKTSAVGMGSFSIAAFPITFDALIPLPSADSNGEARSVTLKMYFASRSDPFRVSVSGYSGAGFFGIVTTLKQVVVLECSIAVGYLVGMEFGQIGTAEVSAFVGIYYRRERDTYVLEGFVVLKGHVNVFQLIDLSISLSLHLRYVARSNSLVGEAILRVSMDVLFFHASREYRVRREYQGSSRELSESGRRLRFTDRVKRDHWNRYVAAFG